MNNGKFGLVWPTYSDHLKVMMKELMMNDEFADVTHVSEDKKHIKAHKNILSACSPVFKDILKLDQSVKSKIDVKGVNTSDIESLMQFIYLGEVTLYVERVHKFLALGRSLKIKELCNAEPETNDEPTPCDLDTEEQFIEPCSFLDKITKDNNDKHKFLVCDADPEANDAPEDAPSHSVNSTDFSVNTFKSSHMMIETKYGKKYCKYVCNQCDRKFKQAYTLSRHIKSKHEGLTHKCNQCNYKATYKSNLDKHIKAKHEGFKYACDQCDYLTSWKKLLKFHIKSAHEGVKYVCSLCDHQFTQPGNLNTHIILKHSQSKSL